MSVTQFTVWFAQCVFYTDFYGATLEDSKLKQVHLNKYIRLMKIRWLLADKIMYFYLPAAESVLKINGNMIMQKLGK